MFSTFYRRLKYSKVSRSILGIQSTNLLMAGKMSVDDDSATDSDVFIRAKDRGGLWIVTPEVHNIFSEAEFVFREQTQNFERHIDCKKIVSMLIENITVLCNYNKLRNQCSEKVSKEIAMNLLDHLLTLYIRVRTFSLVSDKVQRYKLEARKRRSKALRTEMKQASSSMDQEL